MAFNPVDRLASILSDEDGESQEEASDEDIIEEIERLREIQQDHSDIGGFTPDLITEYNIPTSENIFLDENVLISIKDNKKQSTTAYLEVEDVNESNFFSGDGRYYRKMDFEETVDEMISLLEEAINQEREIFYPSTFTGWENEEAYQTLTDLLEEHGTAVDITPLDFSEYPEDAGIAVEAMERDAVIATYDADFADDEDFVMQHLNEVYTPSQIYNSIKQQN